jgi:hypothetical protein
MTITSTRRFALTLAVTAAASLSPLPALGAETGTVAQNKATIQLGDLDKLVNAQTVGAPVDPCALGWAAFPAEVRPQPEKKPKLKVPAEDDVFATGCRYDNGDTTTVNTEKGGTPQLGRNFITLIVWGEDGKMSAAVADHKGSQPATFGTKQGLIKAGQNNASKEPSCTAILKLAKGAIGVSITNGRFPGDTCAIATHVANHIAQTTP